MLRLFQEDRKDCKKSNRQWFGGKRGNGTLDRNMNGKMKLTSTQEKLNNRNMKKTAQLAEG